MPKVGEEKFPYTPEGIQAAAEESAQSGIPVSNAVDRSTTTYAGGGVTGYNIPQYKEGSMVGVRGLSPSAKRAKYEKEQKEKSKKLTQSTVDKLASKRDAAEKGSKKWKRLQNRINRLKGDTTRYKQVSPFTGRTPKGAKPLEAVKKKAEEGKTWKAASKKAKAGGESLSSLVSERGKHKKGTEAYNAAQNKINKAYGVEKRHKVKVALKPEVKPKPSAITARKAVKDTTVKDYQSVYDTMKKDRSETKEKRLSRLMSGVKASIDKQKKMDLKSMEEKQKK